MSNGAQQASGSATYRMLRELGSRAQHSFAATREPNELVVVQRFVRVRTQADAVRGNAGGATPLDAEAMALLLRDARCLAKNWHPNIGRVRHVDLSSGPQTELTIASELIDGSTLEDLIDAAQPSRTSPRDPLLPLPVLVRILLDVLAGVNALHTLRDGMNAALGAFHGELCPANIVVGKDGVARIVNVLRKRPVHIAQGSEAVAYAAPEALDVGGTDDPRCDVYAAGVILWEGLAGRRLYDGDDPAQVLSRQREGELTAPAIHPSSPFARLADVAMRALSFDPALRYRGPAEMAAELRKIAGTRLASGSAVATRVADLAGDRIRSRRAMLEPGVSGTRRRASERAIVAAEAEVEERETRSALDTDPGAIVSVPSLAPLPPPVSRPFARTSATVERMVHASPRRIAKTVEHDVPSDLIAASRPSLPDTTEAPVLASDSLDEDDDDLPGPRGSSPELDIEAALALLQSDSAASRDLATSEPPRPPAVSPVTPSLPFPPRVPGDDGTNDDIATTSSLSATGTPGDFVIPIEVTETLNLAAPRQRRHLALVALAAAIVLGAMGGFVALRSNARARAGAGPSIATAPPAAAPAPPPARIEEPAPTLEATAIAATPVVHPSASAAPAVSGAPAASASSTSRPAPRAPAPLPAAPVKPKKSIYEPDGL